MDDLLNLFRDATGTIYDGDLHGYPYNEIDQDNNDPLPGQAGESDVDEEMVVESEESDEDSDVDAGLDPAVIRNNEWRLVTLDVGGDRPRNFDFDEFVGPRLDSGVSVTSPAFDFFSLFVTPELLETVAEETNIYAEWRQQRERKEDKYWKPVTSSDIRIYLAIQYLMGIHKLPEYQMYWSSDDRLKVEGIAGLMGKSRYEKVHQYFHLNNPANEVRKGQDGYDPLFKVRPLIDHMKKRASELYAPSQHLSIDEGMIGFRGRLFFKQYMKGKPCPWGIKVWCLADPTNGYLVDYNIYTGKSEVVHPKGIGYQVVTELGEPYFNKGYHFFYDNFFASVALSTHLLAHNTHSCSTIRTNRRGWPEQLKDRATSKMKKGDVKFMQANGLTGTLWRDKRKVALLSTNVSPAMFPVQRRAPGGFREAIVPSTVLAYNKSMFGVDLADQHRSYYGMGRSGLKWWRYVAWFLFQSAMINSWILFKLSNMPHPKNRRLMTQVQFRLDVCTGLVSGCKSRKRRATDGLPATVGIAVPEPSEHQPIRLQGLKKGCVECRVNGRKTPSGITPTTTNGCSLCKVHLCKGHCFAQFHEKLRPIR